MFQEGLIVVLVGGAVVMGILLLLVGIIELLIRFDEYMSDRERAKKIREQPVEEQSRVPGEVAAAIGLALHQFFEEQQQAQLAVLERPRYHPWSASSRHDIMISRQRIASRRW